MESKQNSTKNKQEILLQEVKDLETRIIAVKNNIHLLENEEKQENYKKNFLEVRKDNLSQSIESFRNESKKTDKEFEQKLTALSKLSMIDECYDKLLEVFREKYFSPQNSNPCQENSFSEERIFFEKQAIDSQKQIDKLKSIIDENSCTMQNYLEDMHYVVQ